MNGVSDIERRLTETFRAVGEQTSLGGLQGFERIEDDLSGGPSLGFDLDGGTRRNVTWLAAAAIVLLALGAGSLYRLGVGQAGTQEAAGIELGVVESDLDDGRLYLLPPEGTDLAGGVYFQEEPTKDEGTAMILARETETGFDQVVMVARVTEPTFGGNGRSVTIAGRELIEPGYLEPGDIWFQTAAEETPDGWWIEYTTAAGSEVLAEVVAATTVVGKDVSFLPISSDIEQQGEVFDVASVDITVLNSPNPRALELPKFEDYFQLAIVQEGPALGALLFGSFTGPLTRVEVAGQPGYRFEAPPQDPNNQRARTALSWTHSSGKTVVLTTERSEQETADFARDLQLVDRETWLAEIEAINEEADVDGFANNELTPQPSDAQDRSDAQDSVATAPPAFQMATPMVHLEASSIEVTVAGRTFTPTRAVEVQGDPGTWQEYTTLELTWFEDDVEMRIYIYFTSDGTDWWADEIRTYDGAAEGEWITAEGEYFRRPLGTPFIGDLSLDNLKLEGLMLEAFRQPEACQNPDGDLAIVSDVFIIYGTVGVGAEYVTTLSIFDTETCEPTGLAGVTFGISADDAQMVSILDSSVEMDDGGDGVARVELRFEAVGETTLSIEARDLRSGEPIDSIEVPVVVRELPVGGS